MKFKSLNFKLIIFIPIIFFGLFGVASPKLGVGGLVGIAEAATVTALSCENKTGQTDVQNAINLASDGDTVFIPTGSCTWTSGITNTKEIILQGAGIDNITIDCGSLTDCIDVNVPNGSHTPLWRIFGFTFTGGSSSSGLIIKIDGTGRNWRVDHNKFNEWTADSCIAALSNSYGLVDHNTFTNTMALIPSGVTECVEVDGEGVANDRGFSNWETAYTWGTSDAVFIEDNTVSYTTPAAGIRYSIVVNGTGGARIVTRHNTILNGVVMWHGFDSGRYRGSIGGEVYNNTFVSDKTGSKIARASHPRSGVLAFHDNSVANYQNSVVGYPYRENLGWYTTLEENDASWPIGDGTQWKMCSGSYLYSCNDSVASTCTTSGWPCSTGKHPNPEQLVGDAYCQAKKCSGDANTFCTLDATCRDAGGICVSGKCTGYPSVSCTLDSECQAHGGTCTGSYLVSSSSTCSYMFCSGDRDYLCNPSSDPCPALGKGTCSVYIDQSGTDGYPLRDQPGIGPGGQTPQPLMSWSNSYCSTVGCAPVPTTAGIISGSTFAAMQENRDYFNCTSFNDTGDATSCVSKITASGITVPAYVLDYKTYQYPHPLTLTGDTTSPTAPTGLAVN